MITEFGKWYYTSEGRELPTEGWVVFEYVSYVHPSGHKNYRYHLANMNDGLMEPFPSIFCRPPSEIRRWMAIDDGGEE
jgi:hypothetical protein